MHPLHHQPTNQRAQCLSRWTAAIALLAAVSACSVVPKSVSTPATSTTASTSTSSSGTAAANAGSQTAPAAAVPADVPLASTPARPSADTQVVQSGSNPSLASNGNAEPAAGVQPSTGWTESGVASWYGPRFQGKLTANGERFNTHELTAAHKTLPFGTRVRVKSLVNGKEVVVRINDRGPFIKGRIIDLSKAAAQAIGLIGIKKVEIERLR
jgi:rare lipoprotein A